jgi:DNA-binding response OmpR family regulator
VVGDDTSGARVLVVEDDDKVAEVVTRYLVRDGFHVETVRDGRVALERAVAEPPDLIVLDIMLPGLNGLEVCRRLREMGPVPIIMLTALGDETDRIAGLDIGADDYMTKPFSPRELTARARSVLRRARGAQGIAHWNGPLQAGNLAVDVRAREARVGGMPITLTAREFELLVFLMLRPRQVLTREELLEQVWGYVFGDKSTVTVHVRRLREKIEADPARPTLIKTVWGVGYRFDP